MLSWIHFSTNIPYCQHGQLHHFCYPSPYCRLCDCCCAQHPWEAQGNLQRWSSRKRAGQRKSSELRPFTIVLTQLTRAKQVNEAVACIDYLASLGNQPCVATVSGQSFCRRGNTQITGIARGGATSTSTWLVYPFRTWEAFLKNFYLLFPKARTLLAVQALLWISALVVTERSGVQTRPGLMEISSLISVTFPNNASSADSLSNKCKVRCIL
jgi:hypothetical protein